MLLGLVWAWKHRMRLNGQSPCSMLANELQSPQKSCHPQLLLIPPCHGPMAQTAAHSCCAKHQSTSAPAGLGQERAPQGCCSQHLAENRFGSIKGPLDGLEQQRAVPQAIYVVKAKYMSWCTPNLAHSCFTRWLAKTTLKKNKSNSKQVQRTALSCTAIAAQSRSHAPSPGCTAAASAGRLG
jgi:hypothetical protein